MVLAYIYHAHIQTANTVSVQMQEEERIKTKVHANLINET